VQGEVKMVNDGQGMRGRVLTFGPFRLLSVQRLLMEDGKPIRLGSRALDILFALVEGAGELVGRDELIARVWPGTVVEEGTLRVHINALRKALGDRQSGVRYVENVTGRGYRFVAPVARHEADEPLRAIPATDCRRNMPAPLTRMIGRSEIVSSLATRLPRQRFMTIVGPGGIGKTTVALAVAGELSGSYADGACFVDLASLADPLLVSSTLATLLGLAILSEDPVPTLIAFLKDKQMLIVLDNCEHVVEVAAVFAEKLLRGAPGVHVLATSREPLGSEGEWVHRLSTLETPPAAATLTAAEALVFPAIQLFTERAMASSDTFELRDADVPIVADLCRRVDGMPLAIELLAARVELFGLRGLAARLDDRFRLLTNGRRTASPRHQTLWATLDWSYELLSETERLILRRIAVFAGGFDLASAVAIASDGVISAADVFDHILSLCAKSLVAADVTDETVVYRLLETTRAHALEKLRISNESAEIRQRHAVYFCTVCDGAEAQTRSNAEWLTTYGREINDVRAALDWCFSPDGDASIGTRLAAASAPVWFRLSVLDEYGRRLERALQYLKTAPSSDAALEMRLNTMFGHVLLNTGGPKIAAAFNRALEIASPLGNTAARWQALYGLAWERLLVGEYSSAVAFSERAHVDSIELGEETTTMSHRLMGLTHHFAGNHTAARDHCERVLSHPISAIARRDDRAYRLDHRVATRATLSRILWVQGLPEQAARTARLSIEDGLSSNDAASLCFALVGACPVMLWIGNMSEAGRLVALLLDHATRLTLAKYHFWGRCFDAALAVRHGDTANNAALRNDLLGDPLCDPWYVDTLGTLSEDLVGLEAIARAQTGRSDWCAAEILRVKATVILKEGTTDAAGAAEPLFRRSLDKARQQGALSWELRTATSLARLWQAQGRIRDAHALLASVYARFTEGFETADLMAARALLDELSS
jgi:predicted ATPase/DNA-binding winged helix-turn-helix (wHTH) protein